MFFNRKPRPQTGWAVTTDELVFIGNSANPSFPDENGEGLFLSLYGSKRLALLWGTRGGNHTHVGTLVPSRCKESPFGTYRLPVKEQTIGPNGEDLIGRVIGDAKAQYSEHLAKRQRREDDDKARLREYLVGL